MRLSLPTYFRSIVNILDVRVNIIVNLIVDVLLVLSIIIINLLLVG